MFCRKCGEKLKTLDKFCIRCGEPVSETPEGDPPIVLEPPKDLIWNIEGFPKDKKTPELSIDWEGEPQGREYVVDDFYVDKVDHVSAQKLLDEEIEKLHQKNQARDEAIAWTDSILLKEAIEKEEIQDEAIPVETEKIEPMQQETQMSDVGIQNTSAEELIPTEPETVPAAVPNKYEQIFLEVDEEEERHKFTFGKFLLILVLLLVLAEAAFLGLRYYMPEHPGVKMANEQVARVVETVQKWFTPIKVAEEDPLVEDPVNEEPAAEDPVKEDPVAEAPVNPYPDNVNIKEIRINPGLAYVSGQNYGIADINKSLPVTEDTTEVINTVVAYDSKWIDYVNKGDKGVIELTAPGSQAQLNTLSFTKVGKITETFLSLEIGEIRKGVKGYYVWVQEKIQIEENSMTTTKTFAWIYQVAPYEGEMKIVNYFSYI